MRLALEVFGLELALTFGPVDDDQADDDQADDDPTQLQHVEGGFDLAPAAGDPLDRGVEYEERRRMGRRGVGFGVSGSPYVPGEK